MTDPVNHRSHYTEGFDAEVIDITRHLSFNRGNAVKYLARAGRKDPATELQDLQKAAWYVADEIGRVERAAISTESAALAAVVLASLDAVDHPGADHELRTDHNGDPICACGHQPRLATLAATVGAISLHVSNMRGEFPA